MSSYPFCKFSVSTLIYKWISHKERNLCNQLHQLFILCQKYSDVCFVWFKPNRQCVWTSIQSDLPWCRGADRHSHLKLINIVFSASTFIPHAAFNVPLVKFPSGWIVSSITIYRVYINKWLAKNDAILFYSTVKKIEIAYFIFGDSGFFFHSWSVYRTREPSLIYYIGGILCYCH